LREKEEERDVFFSHPPPKKNHRLHNVSLGRCNGVGAVSADSADSADQRSRADQRNGMALSLMCGPKIVIFND
jgi:hypothetical protein